MAVRKYSSILIMIKFFLVWPQLAGQNGRESVFA